MCRNRVYIFLGILCLFLLAANKPKNNLEELSEKIISLLTGYVDENPEEKVFLHLDKDNYAAGEDIWFSVYLTAGSPDIPSPLSKTVYVDMLDNDGKLIEQKTIKIQEGHGFGDFKLPLFIPEGIYHIKAYSTWLRGFGEEQVFARAIEVLEPQNMNFQPQVNFSFEEGSEKGVVKYVGNIKAFNKNQQPIKDKNIKYQLITSRHLLGEGELSLDGEGTVDLEVVLNESDLATAVFLKFIYEENENYQIVRQFRFPFSERVIDLQFMPEGGEIIADFPNKVAFRAVYPDGSPAEVKGEIVADGYSQVFETNANGLGVISLTPEASKNYQAFMIGKKGEKQEINFPKVQAKGVNLTVDSSNPQLLNLIIQTKDYGSLDPTLQGLLVIHARGRIGYMQKLDLQKGITGARVPKNQLASGINQVTIFNSEGKPLAERLVYVDFEQTPQIDIQAQSSDFSVRGKNSIKLHLDADVFEGGIYSVSITDAGNPYGSSENSNIITYLKFASELNGKISDKQLFQDGKLDAEAVDLIMLTHGWRRFNWDKVFEGSLQNPAHIELGINITGTVTPKYKSKRVLDGGTLNFFSRGAEDDFIVAEFAENGRFIIDGLDFSDTTTLVLKAEDRRQKDMLEITVDEPASKYAQWETFEPLLKSRIIHPAFKEYLETAEKRRQTDIAFADPDVMDLDEFVVEHRRSSEEKDGITRIYGRGNKVLKVADIPGAEAANSVFELLQGRWAGVQFKGSGILIRGGARVLVLLDNVPIDIDMVNIINPRDIDTIEAFTDGASQTIFGPAGANGVIAIYTKRGGSSYSPAEGILHAKYPGYSTAREFYMPKYDEEKSPKPDFRTTLYWNPMISWNGKEAEIEFFNNDVSDRFRVVVQGIDRFGRLTYAEKVIN